MKSAEMLLISYAANALWMVLLFAAFAAAIVRLIRRAPAAHRHIVWATALVLSLILPFAKTFPAAAVTPSPSSSPASFVTSGGELRASVSVTPSSIHALAALYLGFMLIRMTRLARALQHTAASCRGALVQYADVATPFTAGIRRSVIVLPRSLARRPSERRAAIAHERAHIRRHDFAFNLLYEIALIPVAWHPAALFIKSQIDRTRELACDDLAARVPASYARMLLRLAHLMTPEAPAHGGVAVSMFDSDSLEARIRNLLERPARQARTIVALAIASLIAVSVGAATQAIRVTAPDDVRAFAGHWVADFQGHPFFSMEVDANGGGTIANFGILVNSDGEVTSGEPRPGFARVTEKHVEGATMHIVTRQAVTTSESARGSQRLVLDFVLISRTRGEIRIPGSRVKPWMVERR